MLQSHNAQVQSLISPFTAYGTVGRLLNVSTDFSLPICKMGMMIMIYTYYIVCDKPLTQALESQHANHYLFSSRSQNPLSLSPPDPLCLFLFFWYFSYLLQWLALWQSCLCTRVSPHSTVDYQRAETMSFLFKCLGILFPGLCIMLH